MSDLPKKLSSNHGPDYYDSNIVAAYLLIYHLKHCVMAYRAFSALFRATGIPDQLYVRDFGAGADTGWTGLIVAPKEESAAPTVHFNAVEPSDSMRTAAKCFRERLRTSHNAFLHYSKDSDSPDWAEDTPNRSLRIVTAFHMSLPFYKKYIRTPKGYYARAGPPEVPEDLKDTQNVVKPHAGLLSCDHCKIRSLEWAVGPYFRWREFVSGRCDVSESKYKKYEKPAAVYTNTAHETALIFRTTMTGNGPCRNWAITDSRPPKTLSCCGRSRQIGCCRRPRRLERAVICRSANPENNSKHINGTQSASR